MALKLLVVDDDLDILRGIKNLLESLGYEVLALADSREAARRVEREKLDGVFLDACMPGMNGCELACHIRNHASNASVPIIMLTGYNDVDTMRAGFKAGVTFFMGKPLQLTRLAAFLKSLHGAMLRERRSYMRLPLRSVVNCRTEKNQFTSASLDISEGGMMLEPSGGLTVGTEVELQFALPGIAGIVNPRATVVRRDPPDRIAVKFSELSLEDREAIQDFVAGLVKE